MEGGGGVRRGWGVRGGMGVREGGASLGGVTLGGGGVTLGEGGVVTLGGGLRWRGGLGYVRNWSKMLFLGTFWNINKF